MRFERIKYMDWFKTRPTVKYDLCRSGVESLSMKNLGVTLGHIDIYGENVYGYPPLIEAIAARYGVKEENVVTTLGTSCAIFLACAAMIDPGDGVLVEKPAYEPLLAVPKAMGAAISRCERKFGEGYQIDLERFESIVSPQTRLIILTNLHNPSGVLLSRSEVREMAKIAKKKSASLVVDEIYLDFLEGQENETSFLQEENIVVISSLTKVYGLGGLRCGWILASPELADRMRRIIDYFNVEGVFMAEQLSSKAFRRLGFIKKKNQERIEQNRHAVKRFIQEEEKLSWVEPAGGIICFPRVEGDLSGDGLAEILRRKYDTAVVPGSFFEEPQHFRLGFDVSFETLARGLENIRKVLRGL